MLALTGRVGDGWLPSVPYLEAGAIAAGSAAIDAAALEAGREPAAVRRLLDVSGVHADGVPGRWDGEPASQVGELPRLALEDGISTLVVMADDAGAIQSFAGELALVHHINHPEGFDPLRAAIDLLTDALLSRPSHEEQELVEPLARTGFHPGQV